MSSQPVTHLYRSLLRELRLASKQPRGTRNMTVTNHVRVLVNDARSDEGRLQRTLVETRDFLRASRIHGELLKRYNPLHDMTEEERVHATARRVGLDTPIEFKNE
ncbi:hypothetical protein EHS25_006273 [Saitozyma podzolica]|uniref:Uncharacterized protein n=1 Tax=Saitozyma podzolica TaxID=1890683 RepID=A0A427YRD2_9TREE|nr:hypothetical protein EHS25_006273 [Saitozyma podzolica]